MRCSKTITTTRDKQRQTRREGVKTEAIFQSFFNGNKTRKDKNDTTKNTDGDPLKAPMQNGAPATLINPVINQKEKRKTNREPGRFHVETW